MKKIIKHYPLTDRLIVRGGYMTSILLIEIGVEKFNGKARILYRNHKKL